MLKRLVLAHAAIATLVLSACGGSGSTNVSRSNVLSTTVTVLAAASPVPGVRVTLSTGISGISPSGTLTSQLTDLTGKAVFPALPGIGQLCVSASFGGLFAAQCPYPFPAAVTLSFQE